MCRFVEVLVSVSPSLVSLDSRDLVFCSHSTAPLTLLFALGIRAEGLPADTAAAAAASILILTDSPLIESSNSPCVRSL